MKDLKIILLEKLHIDKNVQGVHKISKDDLTYAVYVIGDDEVCWNPRDGFTSFEELEEYLLDKFKDRNIRYLKLFDNVEEAQEYELNEISVLLRKERKRKK